MNIVVLLLKIALLAFGLLLIAGGGLLGLCGVEENKGDIFVLGLLPALIGFAITVFAIRDFKRRARAGQEADQPPPNEGGQ